MLVPLYGFVQGDTMGLLVLAHDDMLLSLVAERLRQSASVRVSPDGAWTLTARGEVLDPSKTVAEARLYALERIDLRRRPSP